MFFRCRPVEGACCTWVEEPDLSPVASLIVVITDVQRNAVVLNKVNQEPQGEPTIFIGS
jgi:hypothetical protein